MRPLRGLQETRIATREESGVLGFTWRRGLTPRGSLERPRSLSSDRQKKVTVVKALLLHPPSSRAEGLLLLNGLESNPGSSLQTEEEAGLP